MWLHLYIITTMSKKVEVKRKPGRPTIANPASVTIPRVRVTPDQLESYKAAAEKSGKTFSAWVRGTLDRASKS